jgi:hypothetical protein
MLPRTRASEFLREVFRFRTGLIHGGQNRAEALGLRHEEYRRQHARESEVRCRESVLDEKALPAQRL